MRKNVLYIWRFKKLCLASWFICMACFSENFSGSKQTPPVSGNEGPADQFSCTPSVLAFNYVALNNALSQTVTIKNLSATHTLTINAALGLPSVVTMDISGCQAILPQTTCSVTVTYTPTQATLLSQQITIVGTTAASTTPLSQFISLTGNGFVSPFASQSQPYLVGWFAYTPQTVVPFTNTAAYAKCLPDVDMNVKGGITGNPALYCYEPSGANGMFLAFEPASPSKASSTFDLLTQYILNNFNSNSPCQNNCTSGNLFCCTTDFSSLFGTPDATGYSSLSSVANLGPCMTNGVFYYMLAYLIIPSSFDLTSPTTDFIFTSSAIDDGLEFISNGVIMGNQCWTSKPTSFSFLKFISPSKTTTDQLQPSGNCPSIVNPSPSYASVTASYPSLPNMLALYNAPDQKTGFPFVNTLVVIWVDSCPDKRGIGTTQFQYQNENGLQPIAIPIKRPNTVLGYFYNKLNGETLAGLVTVTINGSQTPVGSAQTDSNNFFIIDNLPNGSANVVFTSSTAGGENISIPITLQFSSPQTSVYLISQGI